MHNLSSSFVLGYHGCDHATAERLLQNEEFLPSNNDYDWLGAEIYFWEANPDRAQQWADEQHKLGRIETPCVVGAVIDLGYCLDLTTSNGIAATRAGYDGMARKLEESGIQLPTNKGGPDNKLRRLDCAVVNYLHTLRSEIDEPPFDSVRALFPEGHELYINSGFRDKTHIQICVRNQENIHGVFRVNQRYFSTR